MKIDRLEVIPIRVPNRIPVKLSTLLLLHQDNVIVRLRAGALTGIGETQPLPGFQGCAESQVTIVPLIRERFAPLLVGRNPFDLERIVRDLEDAVTGNPYAKTAVVDALYDLMAKAYGVPLYQLLGGLYRDRIPVVWTIGIKDRREMAEEARWAVGRGFRLLKLKVGALRPEDDVRNVEAVRDAVGPDIGLRLDANGAFSFDQALGLLRDLARFKLDLVEQPLAIHDLEGMARLIRLAGVPVMPDESLHSLASALELVTRKAASIPIYPGGQPGTSVGSATAAHFYAATWNATLGGDFHVGSAGWLADDIVQHPLVVADGYALVPHGVGIGVDIDEEKLEKYTVETESSAASLGRINRI